MFIGDFPCIKDSVYKDEGISGTTTKKRDAFNKLISDCEHGKIDRIYTKSISRFARNTTECLKYVRHLKNLGVTIYFEKENLDTANEETELRLTMLESHAQEESISISKNVRLGEQYRMENGEYLLKNTLYGYDLIDHKLVINQEEADIVRRIYRDFITGKSISQIYRELNDEKIPKNGMVGIWSRNGIVYILTNEKYIGDQMYRKRYRTETFPFKRMRNYGEVDAYGKDKCPSSPTIEEEQIHKSILKALSNLIEDKDTVKDELKAALGNALIDTGTDICIASLEAQLKEQENDMMRVVKICAERGNQKDFEDDFKRISANISDLRKIIEVEKTKIRPSLDIDSRLDRLFTQITEASVDISNFEDGVIRQLIAQIRVDSAEELTIILHNGFRTKAVV